MLPPPGVPLLIWSINWPSVRRVPTVVRSGPRRPPVPSRAWQLRQFLLWNTAAPWRRSGVLFRTRPTGTGSPLQAGICGDQGGGGPRYVSPPRAVENTVTASTAPRPPLGGRAPPVAHERHEEQGGNEDQWKHEDDERLCFGGAERQQGEQPQERPLGPGVGTGQRGIGRRGRSHGPEDGSKDDHRDHGQRR